jgi:hypothetical protein
MAERKKFSDKNAVSPPTKAGPPSAVGKGSFANILARTNRGMLFDILIFAANIFLFRVLAKSFLDIVNDASAGDALAQLGLMGSALGVWLLPGTGAVLKRWHFHERVKAEGKSIAAHRTVLLSGCLFNPLFYFVLNLLITAVVITFILGLLKPSRENEEGVFVASCFLGVGFAAFQTYLVYHYFSTPKRAPKVEFLRDDPRSEVLGDLCILLNMILFQIVWNVLPIILPPRPANVSVFAEIMFRLVVFGLATMLIYFPPRIFYLREDINRPRAWLTIGLANLPLITRLLLGARSVSQ